MKKTIIALLALAGMASAATQIEFTTAPSYADNFWSNSYELTFTLDETYTLADGTILAGYWGADANGSLGANAIVLGGTDGALTLTIGRGDFNNLSNNEISADTTFNMTSDAYTFNAQIETGVTYTLSVTGGNQSMVPTLTWADGTETGTSYKGNMNGDADPIRYGVNNTLIVPEPATATLSLLALAGLAARRRR